MVLHSIKTLIQGIRHVNALESVTTMPKQGFELSVKFTSDFLNILGRNPRAFKNGGPHVRSRNSAL